MTEQVDLLLLCGATSLVIGLMGFIRTVWFISLGYTASVATFCIVTALKCTTTLTLSSALQLGLLFVWATRLGWYILRRETNANYQAAVSDQTTKAQNLPIWVKLQIWLAVSCLYVCMFTPAVLVALAADDKSTSNATTNLGLVVMVTGLVLEVVSDHQKATHKRSHPNTCIQTGLYRWVCRNPNYLGEILVWLGSFVAGLTSYHHKWHWILSTGGLVCICLIMAGSTARLETKHHKRYGRRASFQNWVQTVPILVPGVPIYSFQKTRVHRK